MNKLAYNPIQEDRYITYLAGLPQGSSPIGMMDKWNSYGAQKHPIRNTVISNILGVTSGVAMTALGTATVPLFRDGIQATFFASKFDVCMATAGNVKNLFNAFSQYDGMFKGSGVPDYLNKFFAGNLVGIESFKRCMESNEQEIVKGKVFNYAANVWDVASNNAHYLLGAAVGLTALFTYMTMNDFTDLENQTEADLIKSLKDRYERIGTRLTDLKTNPDAQKCADRILKNQLQINQEIEALQLPNLSWKQIRQITEPVFEAAQNMLPK